MYLFDDLGQIDHGQINLSEKLLNHKIDAMLNFD